MRCCGLWGFIWGHRFQPRYSVTTVPPKSNDVLQHNLFDRPVMAEKLARKESTYECDICTRCGATRGSTYA